MKSQTSMAIWLILIISISIFLSEISFANQEKTPLIVGSEIDFPPYAIRDTNGEASGSSVDLIKAVSQVMGLSINIWPDVLKSFKDRHTPVAIFKERSQLQLDNTVIAGNPIKEYSRRFTFAVQNGNTELRDKLNYGIAIVRATGGYDNLYNKWFGGIEHREGLPWNQISLIVGILLIAILVILAWGLTLNWQIRKRTSELALSENKFKQIVELPHIGIWIIDKNAYTLYMNPKMAKMLGYSTDEVVGRHLFDFMDDAGINDAKEKLSRRQEGVKEQHEFEFIKKDGKKVITLLETSPAYDDTGDYNGAIAGVLDITEMKKIENDLVMASTYMQSTLDSASDGILAVDLNGVIKYFNNRFLELWRIPRALIEKRDDEKLLDYVIEQLIHPGLFIKEVRKLYSDSETISIDTLEFKDGRFYTRYSVPQKNNGKMIGRVWSFTDITLNRKREMEIVMERDKLSMFMDSLDAGIYSINKDYQIEYINPLVKRDFGAVNDRKCYKYIYDRDEICPWCKMPDVFSGKTIYWEWEYKNRVYKRYDAPLKNSDNSISKIAVFYDITELKSIQRQLQRELNFQTTFAKVTEAFLNPKLNKYDLSTIVYQEALILTESLYGYVSIVDDKTGDNISVNLTDMIDNVCKVARENQTASFPKGLNGYNALWGYSLNTGEPFYTNAPVEHPAYKNCIPAGHVQIDRFLSVPVKNGDKIIGQFALANADRDYTDEDLNIICRLASIYAIAMERKQIEVLIQENEDLLKTILRILPVGLWIQDAEGKIIEANTAAQEIWRGAKYVGMEGFGEYKAWWRSNGKKIEPEEWSGARAITKGETSINEEIEIECFDGTHKIILSSSVPLYDTSQKIKGVVSTNQDITELKESERKLSDLNKSLEQRVIEEIDKRMRNEQILIQQSKMASMGEMISMISHQWRQPLNVIGLFIQDIKEASRYNELDEEYLNNSMTKMMQQIEFMSKTIDDFRNFLKPSKEKSLFDIKMVTEEVILMFTPYFKKNEINLRIVSRDNELLTTGYPNEFKQVILNLISNARDAILLRRGKGITGVCDTISILLSQDDDRIIVSIQDTGGGIPEEIIYSIFEPYFTTKGIEKGTGIGLYMSKAIIENNMGWRLSARNIEGGAEFRIEI